MSSTYGYTSECVFFLFQRIYPRYITEDHKQFVVTQEFNVIHQLISLVRLVAGH